MKRLRKRKYAREREQANERASVLLRDGDAEQTLRFIQESIARFPDDGGLRILLAILFLYIRPEDATKEALKGAEVEPENAGIQVRAGHLLYNQGDPEGARQCAKRAQAAAGDGFRLAIELDMLVGLIAGYDGEHAKAERMLRAAVVQSPEWSNHWRTLAGYLQMRKRYDDALSVIDEALDRFGEDEALERLRSRVEARRDHERGSA